MRWTIFSLLVVACGARTELRGEPVDSSVPLVDSGHDVHVDVSQPPDVFVKPDVQPGPCTLGPNVGLPTAQCGGDQVDWFATPYTPPVDITVARIEAHMGQGHVAILASDASGMPGAVLFVGTVGTTPQPPSWIGTNVVPNVALTAGTPYFIGFQGDCSFSVGGTEPVEYMAPSVNGPWHDQGTDNWTARLIGTCE